MPLSRKQIRKASYARHRNREIAGMKAWRQANKEKILAYNAAYREAHPEWTKAVKRGWRMKHGEDIRSRERARYEGRKAAGLCGLCGKTPPRTGKVECAPCAARNAERLERRKRALDPEHGERAMHLMKEWRLTIAEWDAMFALQGRCCAICSATAPGLRWWHLDHDHRFAKRDRNGHRGILCGTCNKGLGIFRDDPNLLSRAIDYLRKHTLTIVG